MKIEKNIYSIICFIIVCIVSIGCTPKNKVIYSEKPLDEIISKENSEKNDLMDLADDYKVIPLEHPKHGIISGTSVIIDVESEIQDSAYQYLIDLPDEIDSLNSQAYRVQIFTSKKYGESKHARVVAEEMFDRPVFLDYEVPYYKIRVGNFPNREQAEDYQQKVKSSGYKNAWVVAVIVNVKETSALYDEILFPEVIDSLNKVLDESEENNE